MRLQNIHAHFDDFEFTAAGIFELARRQDPAKNAAQVVVCTDGAAGHHQLPREETARTRLQEQQTAAAIGQYDLAVLHYPDGSVPREGCMMPDRHLLAALWKYIRDFKPDYLFCPPIPTETLTGVHVDHLAVAQGMRQVAYLLNVPHAYTPEYPELDTGAVYYKPPVILNVYDGYMLGGNAFDIAINIDEVFDVIAESSWCHQSQIREWLPWVGNQLDLLPENLDHWKRILRERFKRQNRDVGIVSDHLYECFTLTNWGSCPSLEEIVESFPGLDADISHLDQLAVKIRRFS